MDNQIRGFGLVKAHDLRAFVSLDFKVYDLACVQYRPPVGEDSNGSLSATNGKILVRVPVHPVAEMKIPEATLLFRADALALLKNQNDKRPVTLVLDGARIVTRQEDEKAQVQRCIVANVSDTKYSDTDEVFPKTPEAYRASFAAGLLRRLADYACRVGLEKELSKIEFVFYSPKDDRSQISPIVFNFEADQAGIVSGLIMPMEENET